MWFALGIAVGILLSCLAVWLNKKFFIVDDILFDMRYADELDQNSSFDDTFIFCDDKPRGKPIPFKDWEKKYGK